MYLSTSTISLCRADGAELDYRFKIKSKGTGYSYIYSILQIVISTHGQAMLIRKKLLTAYKKKKEKSWFGCATHTYPAMTWCTIYVFYSSFQDL